MAGDDNDAMPAPGSPADASADPAPGADPAEAAEAATTPPPLGAVRLHDWGVIRAGGADARSFLHGQLTQDVAQLAPGPDGAARLAGYCTAKGRLLASFVLWADSDDGVLLACSADVLAGVLKRLRMFVLRARCTLADASADVPLWGIAGDAAAGGADGDDNAPAEVWARRTSAAGGTLIRLPDALADAQAGGRPVARWLQAGGDAPAQPPLAIDSWRWLEALSGTPRIVAATSEQFVPQMINLELVGGVNFQKGCYPGQEIVARSQYRGSVKRRAQVLTADAALAPGQAVFHSADPAQPAGMVVLAGSHGARHAALAEVKLAALPPLAGGSLHAGSADGPLLRVTALPYPIPTDAP